MTSYAKVESNNLNFHRQNQNRLRVEEYQGLRDYLNRRDDPEGEHNDVGRMVILPSTYRVNLNLNNIFYSENIIKLFFKGLYTSYSSKL